MKPARFSYHRPDTVDEAISLLVEHGEDAKVLAGGQSLVPMMNLRLAQPAALVDICGIAELQNIKCDGSLEIGAVVPQAEVLSSQDVAGNAPLLTEGMRWIGHPANRNRGTFGGSVAHADPAAEIPALLLALDAEILAQGPGGARVIPADDFFLYHLTTTLAIDELLTGIRIPLTGSQEIGWGFQEVARRQGDFALAGAAFCSTLDQSGSVETARISLFGVSGRPVRATEAEDALVGHSLDDENVMQEVGQLVQANLDPDSDHHASAQYRKEVASVLVVRAIAEAHQKRRSNN